MQHLCTINSSIIGICLNTSFSFSCPSSTSGPYTSTKPEAPLTRSHVTFMVLRVTSSNWRPVTEGRATTHKITHKHVKEQTAKNKKPQKKSRIYKWFPNLDSVLKNYLSCFTNAGLIALFNFDLSYCKRTCCFWSSQSFACLVHIDSKHSQLVFSERAEMV